MQNSSITLPADGKLTALVPSESAIRRLRPEDQAFWLQPKTLPELVRWGELGRKGHGGDSGWDLDPSQTMLREFPWLTKVGEPRLKELCNLVQSPPPPTLLLRAHFLQGAFSEEELARLSGQQVATLSATTHWQIHNTSGVRGELWTCVGAAPHPQTRAPRK